MAAKHNITLAVDSGLLKKAKAIAAGRGRSVSALLADELSELVAEDQAYVAAQRTALAMLESGFPLSGTRMQDRDAVHERHRLR